MRPSDESSHQCPRRLAQPPGPAPGMPRFGALGKKPAGPQKVCGGNNRLLVLHIRTNNLVRLFVCVWRGQLWQKWDPAQVNIEGREEKIERMSLGLGGHIDGGRKRKTLTS